jgi:hypothetical protein
VRNNLARRAMKLRSKLGAGCARPDNRNMQLTGLDGAGPATAPGCRHLPDAD